MKAPETLRHEQRVWELACNGLSGPDIAARVVAEGLATSYSKQHVHVVLQRIQADILAEMRSRGEQEKARQHERLMYLWREALEAWEKSKQGKPDARFLVAATGILGEISKVWGLNAPTTSNVNVGIFTEAEESPWAGATVEELEALRAMRRRIEFPQAGRSILRPLPTDAQLDYLLASRRLTEFARQGWHVIEPSNPFVDGWHVGCIAEHLEALTALQMRKLIINIPPRHMKSLLVAVFRFCWSWARDPASRWLFSSYGEDLSSRDSVRCRDIITSGWYQARWGGRFRLKGDQNVKTRFANDRQGWRIATTVDGKATGEGGDYIIADDPHKVQEVRSGVKRGAVIDWWGKAMSTRANDPKTGRFVVVMQRLHERDLTGHLIAEQLGYEHLCLPCEFEPKRYYLPTAGTTPPKDSITPTSLQRQRPELRDLRAEEGELLWPQRFGPDEVRDLKASLQAVGTAGQLQQRPSPADGTVFKADHFRRFTVEGEPGREAVVLGVDDVTPAPQFPVSRLRFFQCIDTASTTGQSSAYTTVGTFAVTPSRHLLVWHVFRARLEVPEQSGDVAGRPPLPSLGRCSAAT